MRVHLKRSAARESSRISAEVELTVWCSNEAGNDRRAGAGDAAVRLIAAVQTIIRRGVVRISVEGVSKCCQSGCAVPTSGRAAVSRRGSGHRRGGVGSIELRAPGDDAHRCEAGSRPGCVTAPARTNSRKSGRVGVCHSPAGPSGSRRWPGCRVDPYHEAVFSASWTAAPITCAPLSSTNSARFCFR